MQGVVGGVLRCHPLAVRARAGCLNSGAAIGRTAGRRSALRPFRRPPLLAFRRRTALPPPAGWALPRAPRNSVKGCWTVRRRPAATFLNQSRWLMPDLRRGFRWYPRQGAIRERSSNFSSTSVPLWTTLMCGRRWMRRCIGRISTSQVYCSIVAQRFALCELQRDLVSERLSMGSLQMVPRR